MQPVDALGLRITGDTKRNFALFSHFSQNSPCPTSSLPEIIENRGILACHFCGYDPAVCGNLESLPVRGMEFWTGDIPDIHGMRKPGIFLRCQSKSLKGDNWISGSE
jgi:hypothetical protein